MKEFNHYPEGLIIGEQELKYILKNRLNPDNFLLGEDSVNVSRGVFSANLHIHTHYSDGEFTISELLDQAVKYADYRQGRGYNDPVIIAVTDHDTLFGTQEAVKMITDNPEKYKNIRFVPGIELNAYYHSEHAGKKQLEVLVYCINPFKFADFVEKIRQANLNYVRQLITGSDISFEYLQKHAKYVRAGGSPAFMLEVLEILKNNSFGGISKIKAGHFEKYGSLSINPGTPDVKDIVKAVKESGSGFVSVAHPGRSLKNMDIRQALAELQKIGVEAVEANYFYIPEDNVSAETQAYITQTADETGMIKTGGVDSHKNSLFLGRDSMLSQSVPVTL